MRALRTNVREVLQDGSARAGVAARGPARRVAGRHAGDDVTILMFAGVLYGGGRATASLTLDLGYDRARLLQVNLAPASRALREPWTTATPALPRRGGAARQDGALERRAAADANWPRATAAGRSRCGTDRPNAASAAAQRPGHARRDVHARHRVWSQGRAARRRRRSPRRAPVAAISRTLAARHWPGRSRIGEQLRLRAANGDASRGARSSVSSATCPTAPVRPAIAAPRRSTCRCCRPASPHRRHRALRDQRGGRAPGLAPGVDAVDPQMVPGYVFRVDEVHRDSPVCSRSRPGASCSAPASPLRCSSRWPGPTA